MKKLIIILIALFAFSSCSTLDSRQTRPTFYSYGYYGAKPYKRQYKPVKNKYKHRKLRKCYDGHKTIKPYEFTRLQKLK